jgi:predicted enzyme related to lactoylglutathione lyase
MMMQLKFSRLILFCKDVGLMQDFYATHFGLTVVEGGGSDWVLLRSGDFEIGLHAIPAAYQPEGKPGEDSNVKLVFAVAEPMDDCLARLRAGGVSLREPQRHDGHAGMFCDGEDVEGNVFQLWGH